MNNPDLVVIGCGPAGMSAATAAANAGLDVVVIDEQKQPGGQIYRNVSEADQERLQQLGETYAYGRALVEAMKKSGVTYICGATVWHVKATEECADCTINFSVNNQVNQIQASRLIVATGALERPVPIPGWTLPGVLTSGAGQILLKQSGVLPSRAVIAGTGPLNLLLAQQMIRAGCAPLAIIETQTRQDFLRSMSYLGGALKCWQYLQQGLIMLRDISKAGVKRIGGASDLKIMGDVEVEQVSFMVKGKRQSIDCSTVLLHQGVIPNTQITRSLGIAHAWDEQQNCFRAQVNDWQQTNLPQVYIAGDGAAIGGAKVAELSGRIAALHVVYSLGKMTEDELGSETLPIRRALQRELAIRPFLDAAYKPSEQIMYPEDDITICRCEEITAADIRRYTKIGCKGPNQTKAFGRCGMGPCQGRYCGVTVTQLLAKYNAMHPDEVGYYRIRPPLKPITLGELASLEESTQTSNGSK